MLMTTTMSHGLVLRLGWVSQKGLRREFYDVVLVLLLLVVSSVLPCPKRPEWSRRGSRGGRPGSEGRGVEQAAAGDGETDGRTDGRS